LLPEPEELLPLLLDLELLPDRELDLFLDLLDDLAAGRAFVELALVPDLREELGRADVERFFV